MTIPISISLSTLISLVLLAFSSLGVFFCCSWRAAYRWGRARAYAELERKWNSEWMVIPDPRIPKFKGRNIIIRYLSPPCVPPGAQKFRLN